MDAYFEVAFVRGCTTSLTSFAILWVVMETVLIVGSGAREHALARVFAKRARVFVAPGNAGTSEVAENVSIDVTNTEALVAFAVERRVDLVVVGPELPLSLGIVDALSARNIPAFGPTRAAAALESSKIFMKEILRSAGVPTAAFRVFERANDAISYVRTSNRPLVVKADGLCAGKGVVVARDADEAEQAIRMMMVDRAFGDAGARVVIEETLVGEEASFHVLCDGVCAMALPPAQDHKRIFDADRGPNTGGMGAYAPAPVVSRSVSEQVMSRIIEPTLSAMAKAGCPFRGVLFAGLMIDGSDPHVLEFNVRFGDPEAGVLSAMVFDDLADLIDACTRGALKETRIRPTTSAALSVVLAADGYPVNVTLGDAICGLDSPMPEGVHVLHAGTARAKDGSVVTSGGRVLNVVGTGSSLQDAWACAYSGAKLISFRGCQLRTDVGHRALRSERMA